MALPERTERKVEGDSKAFFESMLNEVLEKRNGQFPRALFAKELIGLGIGEENQVRFAEYVVLDPRNGFGRTMILHRDPDKYEEVSRATQVARGRGNELTESYVVPHVEDNSCEYETFAVTYGKAVLVIWNPDTHEPEEFIEVTEKPIKIGAKTIHSLLYRSPVVVAEEVKVVKPNAPKVDVPWAIKEGDPQVPTELVRLHALADEALKPKD